MYYDKYFARRVILLATIFVTGSVCADDPSTNDVVNLSSDQIARLRQFSAENQYVTSEDGYIINVVHIPAVRRTNKRPVIFNHGTTQSSTYFMVNSDGARPKDYSNQDAGSLSQRDLERLLAEDPTTKCLPLLLASFGHDVYLINRRGTEYSLGKTSPKARDELLDPSGKDTSSSLTDGLASRFWDIGENLITNLIGQSWGIAREEQQGPESGSLLGFLKLLLRPQLNLGSIPNTLDGKYWNFSLDEQAMYDLPAVIKHVLKESGSEKVAYVGHSLGNVLMFMLQSEEPEWADKVEPFLAWSPDIYLGHSYSAVLPLLKALQPLLQATTIPFPPTPITPLTRTLLAALCQTKLAQVTVCALLEDALWGPSELHQLTLPAFVATQFYAVSSHEAATLAQTAEKGKIHKYDFGSSAVNNKFYGQPKPPIYDVGRIRSRSISLWHGERDALATPKDVELFIQDLSVPVDDRYITETPFNHYCLMFDRNVSSLVNIPSLKEIESYT